MDIRRQEEKRILGSGWQAQIYLDWFSAKRNVKSFVRSAGGQILDCIGERLRHLWVADQSLIHFVVGQVDRQVVGYELHCFVYRSGDMSMDIQMHGRWPLK